MNALNFCLKIGVPHKSELVNWGDYYLAKTLGEELERRGHQFFIQILPEWHTDNDFNADVIIHFRGLSKYTVKPHHFNIMWNISHPESIQFEEYNSYDLILVASETYAATLRTKIETPVRTMLQFVDTRLFFPDSHEELKTELLFVGNSRKVMRKIVEDILPPPRELSIYGDMWNGLVPSKYIKERWFPNHELRKLYSSCDILLNDHWQDMKEYGFLNNRFFDAAACKAIIINDDHSELKKLFPQALTYSSRDNLLDLVNDIYNRSNYYHKLSEEIYQQVTMEHSVEKRVNQLMQDLEELYFTKKIKKVRTKLPLKKKINEVLLTYFGYGRTYRVLHKGYMKWKLLNKSIQRLSTYRGKIKAKVFDTEGTKTLINVTSEPEVKALANQLARPLPADGNDPLVSIIIPNKNGAVFLKELIPSLIANTLYQNYEVIVVDNRSNDNSKSFVTGSGDERMRWIDTGRQLNFSESINFGVKHSRGSLIVFLNNDTVPLYGWESELISSFQEHDNCGVVGSRLVYKELSLKTKKGEVMYPGCSVQHDGIKFRSNGKDVYAFNAGKYRNPLEDYNIQLVEEVAAVTAACMITSREIFESVNGFDENYHFGKEDIDFCLKVKKLGKKIYINRKSLLFHKEFSSQMKVKKNKRKNWRLANNRLFAEKWNEYLIPEIWEEKLKGRSSVFIERPLHISFLVTENTPHTTAGDFFSAKGLGYAMRDQFNYQISFLPRRPIYEWENPPSSTDILISMRHDFDVRQINNSKSSLKVAWIRGYIDEWLNKPWIHDYDAIIASSNMAIEAAKKVVAKEKCWGVIPLGITSEFLEIADNGELGRNLDVSFVGNIFEIPRDIVSAIDLEAPYQFHFFGVLQSGRNHPWQKVHHGHVKHSEVPGIYRRSKIVIEDTAPFNLGTVNLRVFEAAASGALVICNRTPGIEELFGDNIILYKDKNDLTEKILYYLSHEEERAQLAERAKEIVLTQHTFQHRASEFRELMIEKLCNKLLYK